jgi:glutaredoxin-like protein DUF836
LSAPGSPAAALTLLTRIDCPLCEEMLSEFKALGARTALPALTLIDVDSDPQLQRRYGLKVPVLLLDSIVVCQHRFDGAELLRLLRQP